MSLTVNKKVVFDASAADFNKQKICMGTIDLAAGCNYLGEALTASDFGFTHIVEQLFSAGKVGWGLEFDRANQKVKLLAPKGGVMTSFTVVHDAAPTTLGTPLWVQLMINGMGMLVTESNTGATIQERTTDGVLLAAVVNRMIETHTLPILYDASPQDAAIFAKYLGYNTVLGCHMARLETVAGTPTVCTTVDSTPPSGLTVPARLPIFDSDEAEEGYVGAVYVDHDATAHERLLINCPIAVNLFVDLGWGNGKMLLLKHTVDAASLGVALYCDDDAVNASKLNANLGGAANITINTIPADATTYYGYLMPLYVDEDGDGTLLVNNALSGGIDIPIQIANSGVVLATHSALAATAGVRAYFKGAESLEARIVATLPGAADVITQNAAAITGIPFMAVGW